MLVSEWSGNFTGCCGFGPVKNQFAGTQLLLNPFFQLSREQFGLKPLHFPGHSFKPAEEFFLRYSFFSSDNNNDQKKEHRDLNRLYFFINITQFYRNKSEYEH